MEFMSEALRDEVHQIVDAFDDGQLADLKRLAKSLQNRRSIDPVLMALASAEFDDEPESDEERRAVDIAKKELAAGRAVSHEDALAELGL